MQNNKENIIVDLTFEFAKEIVSFCEVLQERKKYNLSNQLFRSGTAIGANVREAQNAESKNDFIHKMKMAAKETDETQYWLQLCNESESYPTRVDLTDKVESIQKVLSKIIGSTKKSMQPEIIKSPNLQIN